MAVKITSPSKNGPKISEYERSVMENIRNIRLEYSEIFESVKHSADELAKSTRSSTMGSSGSNEKNGAQNSQHSKQVKTRLKPSPGIKYIRRSARLREETKKSTNYNEQSDSDEDSENKNKKRSKSLYVKFGWFKNTDYQKRDEEYYILHGDSDFIDSDDDDDLKFDKSIEPRPKRRRLGPTSRMAVSQVTQQMLENIVYKSSGKQYSPNGTTCHQCRQKTLDQKSYCRYKGCRGARGMFCGFCLGKRYGEDVAEVLLNPKWACPSCRGYCNCSICRRKQGRNPTGQLASQAAASGYKSVRHMLNNMEGEDTEESENKSEEDNDGDFINDEQETVKDEQEKVTDEQEMDKDEQEMDRDEQESNKDEQETDIDEQETNKDEEENIISESINNNELNDNDSLLNNDVFKAEPSKTGNLNNETDSDETKNKISNERLEPNEIVSDDVDCNDSDEYNSDNEMEDYQDNI